jgi:hypothetical protein
MAVTSPQNKPDNHRGYIVYSSVGRVYRWKPGMNNGSKGPTSLVWAEAISAWAGSDLRQYQPCTSFIPVSRSGTYPSYTNQKPVQDQTGMKVFFKYPIPVPTGILDQYWSVLNNCPTLGKGNKGKRRRKGKQLWLMICISLGSCFFFLLYISLAFKYQMKGNEPILYFKMNLEKNLVMTRFIRQKEDDHILLGKRKSQRK